MSQHPMQRTRNPAQYSLVVRVVTFLLISLSFVVYSDITFPSTEVYMYRTLLSGKPFFMYADATWEFYDPLKIEGRLQLLTGTPQNIALLFTQIPTALSVYLIQAALVFAVCMTLTLIFKELGFDNKYAFYSILVLVCSRALVYSFYHPVLAETLLIVFLATTILFYLRYVTRPTRANLVLLIVSTLLVCVAKISAVFILAVFGTAILFSDLIAGQRVRHRLLAHCIFILIPMAWVVFSKLVAANPGDPMVWKRMYLELTWITDAVVFLFVIPLGTVMPVLGLLRRDNYDFRTQICACLCFTATVYALLLILFGKHGDYYLAPVYFLAVFIAPVAIRELSRLRLLGA